ncbi:MAG: galactose-1-phosphate uridylyltransferase, partial [candidate division WOR-3 bacterium]
MRDFRWDRVRGFCSILAEERGARPLDFSGESGPCPFCPGNEGMTPPEIMRVGEPWRVRVFPNKYPATDLHEVIVDSPRHGVSLSELSDDDLALAVDT